MTETNLAIGALDGEQRPGTMGRVMPGYEAKHRRRARRRGAGRHRRRARPPRRRAVGVRHRATGECRRRRSRPGATSGSTPATVRCVTRTDWFRFLDRMQGRDPPPRREHLGLGGRAGAAAHPRTSPPRRRARPVGAGRGRGDGLRRPRDGARPEPAELMRQASATAARTSRCRATSSFVDELPLTANGKVQKFVLRERGVTDATWDREAAGIKVERP